MQATPTPGAPSEPYNFTRNNPYDRTAPVQLVVPRLVPSKDYMRSIRDFPVPPGSIAVWFFGQNGFILKDTSGPLIGIDLYLTDSCAALPGFAFRLDRQLPVFVEPEDLDIDIFVTTHSHEDHADVQTISRLRKPQNMLFVGPFDSQRIYRECGVPAALCHLIHPNERLEFGQTTIQATFAMPTDAVDLNHTGTLIRFSNGITFYNTGDTAWTDRLHLLLPRDVDICAICINGGFHNLAPMQAALIVQELAPRVAIPCHYDMMINNVGSPEMLRVAMDLLGSKSAFHTLRYYEPWLYCRASSPAAETTTSAPTQTAPQVNS